MSTLPINAELRAGWDGDADALHKILPHIINDPLCRSVSESEAVLRDRIEYLRSGADLAPDFANRMLRQLDKWLRFRWSWDYSAWAVDRFDPLQRVWNRIATYDELLTTDRIHRIIEDLQSRDMQRYSSPAAYLREQRAKAEQVRIANAKASDAAMDAAIDSLSTKQLHNFIEVERAITTGETITAHGSDANFLEKAKAVQAQAQLVSADYESKAALNPGMDPRIYGRHADIHRSIRSKRGQR